MANPVTGFKPSNLSVQLEAATTPTVTNLSVTANVEQSHALQNNLKSLILRNRQKTKTLLSFTSGGTASNYITINAGTVFSINDLDFDSKTLYLKSDTDATIEILELHA